jgi:MtfA peptidase
MFSSWFRHRRRRELLAQPFPEAWEQYLTRNVRHDAWLPQELRAKLRGLVKVFVAEKEWVGCGGLEMSDEIRVTIAGQACLLLLGVEEYYFDHVRTILVYPGMFVKPPEWQRHWGLIEEDRPTLGEAWHRGPVVLSWKHVRRGGRGMQGGRNVVLHEFAHQLDGLDGEMGGTPPLRTAEEYRRWNEVVTEEFHRLVERVRRGEENWLDPYGATNEAEFFAVTTEHFFEEAEEMRGYYPELYQVLSDFYRLDPAVWDRGD